MLEKISKRSVEFENFAFSREQSLKSTTVLVKLQHVMKSKVFSSQNIENFNKIHKVTPAKFKDTQTKGSHMDPILGMDRHMVNIQTLKITHIMAHISNMDDKI